MEGSFTGNCKICQRFRFSKFKNNSLWYLPFFFVMESTLHLAELNQMAGKRNLSPILTSVIQESLQFIHGHFMKCFFARPLCKLARTLRPRVSKKLGQI